MVGAVGLRTLLEPQEVSAVAASHTGGFGKAGRELVVLVLEVWLVLCCTFLQEVEADAFKEWKVMLYNCDYVVHFLHVIYMFAILKSFTACSVCCIHT